MAAVVIIVSLLFIIGLVALMGYFDNRTDSKADLLKARNAELKNANAQLRIATKALRNIANGTSGLPVLDATNALEDIERREDKELL